MQGVNETDFLGFILNLNLKTKKCYLMFQIKMNLNSVILKEIQSEQECSECAIARDRIVITREKEKTRREER